MGSFRPTQLEERNFGDSRQLVSTLSIDQVPVLAALLSELTTNAVDAITLTKSALRADLTYDRSRKGGAAISAANGHWRVRLSGNEIGAWSSFLVSCQTGTPVIDHIDVIDELPDEDLQVTLKVLTPIESVDADEARRRLAR